MGQVPVVVGGGGGGALVTETVKPHVAVLPRASAATQLTGVTPRATVMPEGGIHETDQALV